MMLSNSLFQTLWNFRGFVLGSVKREFQSKYRNSLLGAAWTVIQPLAMITVYTVIFSQIMRAKLPGIESSFAYGIYLCAGILTWGLFAEITSRSQNVFLENANLLKKLSFPRLTLPLIVVLNAGINFAIIFGLYLGFLILSGNFPGWPIFAMLPLLGIMVAFAIGLGVILGVLNVFFRDVGQLFTVVLQFWFWFTPIVYPQSILPEKVKTLLAFNPMASLIAAYQQVLVYGKWPDWFSLLPVTVMALILCILGLSLFRKRAGEMVDEL
jgi:lipopolysaccharide transport system permease protein